MQIHLLRGHGSVCLDTLQCQTSQLVHCTYSNELLWTDHLIRRRVPPVTTTLLKFAMNNMHMVKNMNKLGSTITSNDDLEHNNCHPRWETEHD
jgi:hypothetical protein